jgi:hypothetical protein
MKHPLKTYLAILFMVALVYGCSRYEDPVVIDGVGTWDILSKATKITENSVVVRDTIETSNLGQVHFERSGRAIFIDGNARRDTATWEECLPDSRLIMYPKHSAWMNCAITERTDDAMTLHWENANDEGTLHRVTACTMMIERVN